MKLLLILIFLFLSSATFSQPMPPSISQPGPAFICDKDTAATSLITLNRARPEFRICIPTDNNSQAIVIEAGIKVEVTGGNIVSISQVATPANPIIPGDIVILPAGQQVVDSKEGVVVDTYLSALISGNEVLAEEKISIPFVLAQAGNTEAGVVAIVFTFPTNGIRSDTGEVVNLLTDEEFALTSCRLLTSFGGIPNEEVPIEVAGASLSVEVAYPAGVLEVSLRGACTNKYGTSSLSTSVIVNIPEIVIEVVPLAPTILVI